MRDSDLELQRWNSLRESERLSLAEDLAKELPDGFRFMEIRPYSLGNQQNSIASFEYQSSIFSLIPGVEVTLGYGGRFKPNPEQYESWLETVECELPLEEDLDEYIICHTTALRTCKIKPMLIEVNSHEIGLERISHEEPVIQEILSEYPESKEVEVYKKYRVIRNSDSSIDAFRNVAKTHQQVAEEIISQGFRLPTSDEWEYVCGSGSGTLFRWGDDCPCDHYPIDDNPDWVLHRVPNAFGLHIAENPYNLEIVEEPKILRGGDGGSAMCGGWGSFACWLPLATAFLDEGLSEGKEDDVTTCFARRVYSLNL